MKPGTLIFCSILAAATVTPACALDHYAISAMNVAETISRIGVRVSADQIALPTDVVATTPAPVLKVRSMQRLKDEHVQVRMECVNSDECLPFFVEIQTGPGNDGETAGVAETFPTSRAGSNAVAVRSGAPVTLMLDGAHVHIRIAAVCLQSGAPGQMIRVTDTNHQQIYLAQVIDSSAVKGRLK